MKLRSLEIDGFGCLVDESYSLAPGFNIFFGPNEIGKSTLQQAILALLYGFYTKNRRNKEEDALLERFRPWQSAKFGGWLEYALDAGNAYRVIRNFDGDLETHLLDALTHRDLSAEYERGKLGRLDFAEKQFGLSYAVFVNTCFVRQADLHRLDEVAQHISETVMNLADTGSRDRSVAHAQLLLENAFAAQVGSERASTKPLSTAKRHLQELEDELAWVMQQRARLQSDSLALQKNKARTQAVEDELARLAYFLAREKHNALCARIERIENLTARANSLQNEIAALAFVANFSSAARDDALRLNQMRLTQRAAAKKAQAAAISARTDIETLDAQSEPLRRRARELESARLIPYERQTQAQALERRWQDARRETTDALKQRDETIGALARKRALLPTSANDLALERIDIAWLREQRSALQTARTQTSQAETLRDAAQQAWQTRAQTLYLYLNAPAPRDAPTALKALEQEQDRVSYWRAQRELERAEQQLADLAQAQTRLQQLDDELGALAFVASFLLETRARVSQLESQWRVQRDLAARQAERAAPARAEMETLQAQATPLYHQAEVLRAARAIPTERADEIRALQQEHTVKFRAYHDAQAKLFALAKELDSKQELRAALKEHASLLAAPPETLPVLRAQWNGARERAAQAEARAVAAREEWRSIGMDETEFERLQERLAGVDANLLAELKIPARPSTPARDRRPILLAAMLSAVLGIGGLLLLVLGFSIVGAALLIAALIALSFTLFLLMRRPTPVPAPTDTRITTRGFANAAEMENAFATLQRARPAQERLRETERAFEPARAEAAQYANKLAALLGVDADTLTDEMLANWENQLREWRAQVRELVPLAETRARLERETEICKTELDAATERWRAALAANGFHGADLAKETEALLARAAERAALETLEQKLRAFQMQMETQREILNQAERERAALDSLETELGALCASAAIAEHDTERALSEYHRRADLALKRRELHTARAALEREVTRLLQAASMEQLTAQRDARRADVTRLLARNPALTSSIAKESLPELNDKYRHLVEARPLLEQWVAAENTLESSRKNFDTLRQALAAQLEIGDADRLTPETLDAAENQLRVWAQTRQELDALETQLQAQETAQRNASQNQEQLEQALRALIPSANAAEAELESAVRAFLAQCANRRELESLETQLRALDIERQTQRQQIQEAEQTRRALQATENELRELLARVGIAADDLERGVAEYHQRVERANERAALAQTLDGVEREKRAVLGSDSLAQLVDARDALAPTLAQRSDAEWKTLARSGAPAQWEQQRGELERERVTLAAERATLETRVQAALGSARSVAEIEEERTELHERIGSLTRHGQALTLAQEFLAAAAEEHHRDFLPRLNESVSRSLKFVTDGRYQTVSIDHNDFQVRLEIPERGLPVTPEQLSRGAQEQIYLLLRLGLTELLSRGRERLPLMLDDPLVNYDRARLHHALDFLADLAAQTQILFFTKDAEIVEWFLNKNFDDAQHRLHWLNPDDAKNFRVPILAAAPASAPEPTQELIEQPALESTPASIADIPAPVEIQPSPIGNGYVPPPQRGERVETDEPRHRAPKPELVCWKREGWWQVGVILPDDLARNARLELYQGSVPLAPDHRNETRWLLESLSRNVLVHWVEGRDVKQEHLTLDDAEYFIFKLHGRTQEQGRRVQTISTGDYLALVPDTWQRDETLAGEAARQPEDCAVEGYRAHFFELYNDDSSCIAFLDEKENLVQQNASAQSFFLDGHRVVDDERAKGPLFGLAAPRVRVNGDLAWADIKTIQVGEEGRGEGEWRTTIAVDATQTAQSLAPIAAHGAGWYFVRFKDADNQLVESLDFRFCRGLEKIVRPLLAPMPDAQGHSAATIEIHHDAETFVTPADELARQLELERREGMTLLIIPGDARFDTTRWSVDENTERTLEIVTRVERVWWAFADEAQEPTAWRAECAALTLQDFSAVSEKAFWLRLPAPRWADRTQIRLGSDARALNFRADAATTFTPLRGFENSARNLALGVYPFQIEIQRGDKSYAAKAGELRIAARCLKCDFESLSESEMLEHVRVTHLGEYVRALQYQELVNLDSTLPREIYQCNFPGCLYYSTHDPTLSPTSAIHEHGKKHPLGQRQFQPLQDANVIRERVLKNLLDADKCALCGHILKHPTPAQGWEHLRQAHGARLYQRV